MTAPPDLVIFDCDGVLIDSELIACRVEAEELTRIGYPCTAQDVIGRFVGLSDRQRDEIVERKLGRPLPEVFDEHVRRRLMAAFEQELQAMPGIAGALDRIEAAGVATCVASSSAPERLCHTLGLTGLRDRFEGRVYSASMVARGKPAPDLFLHAAASLGTAPGRCLVIEDSTAGVQAGRAAGMAVLGFTGGSHCAPGHGERLADEGADGLLADMTGLPDLIGALAP